MTILPIVEVGDPVLRAPTRPVTADELQTPEFQRLVDDLIDTMRDANGAGLAAPQVGDPRRVAVVEVRPGNPRYPYKPPVALTVIVNPSLEPIGEETVAINEGCLSVPDLRGELARFVTVRVSFLDRHGITREEERRGLTAGTFQHEIDHLDGVLFLDRVTDPSTFSTWAQFDRFHRAAFEARARALVERVGS
jgi:peptide deformylase